MEVFDRDGRRVGVISDVFGAVFKVECPGVSDLWLGLDVVAPGREGGRVVLEIPLGDLGRYRLSTSD